MGSLYLLPMHFCSKMALSPILYCNQVYSSLSPTAALLEQFFIQLRVQFRPWQTRLIQTIIFSSCGFFFVSFFLASSQPSQIGCLPYFLTWCGLSANFRCRSETCCMRLAANTGRKKSSKICHLGSIAQLCWAISLQLRHVYRQSAKIIKQQYLLHTSPQYGELRPTTS